MTRIGLVTN